MAGALAPVVWLMVLASLLFAAAGVLDGIYPGGEGWSFASYGGLGWTSYAFGIVNLLVALFIARGSERSLTLRIGLAAVFVIERTTTAFFPVPKSLPSVGVHLTTALIEAVILTATWRVWRLGHMVAPTDLALLTLPQAGGAAAVAGPLRGMGPAVAVERAASPQRARAVAAPSPRRIPASASRAIAVLALLLGLAFIAGPLLAGVIPGVTADPLASQSLDYVYALGVVLIGAFAVSGRRLSLILLLVISLILFVERAVVAVVLSASDPTALGLRAIGALLALVLAFVCLAALRSARATKSA